ncbi:MAG TPA: DUF1648 domain-containing protein [Micromonosporaceae bacterium]|nr:DUF1648 domain-containing protein [Micromonosporaceae bacterium]
MRASVGLYVTAVLISAFLLPDRVPLHFGGSGAADRYGSRTELLLVEIAVGVLFAAVFGPGARLLARAPLDLLNVPNPEYWKSPQHEAELRRRTVVDLRRIGTATFVFLTVLVALHTRAAVDGTNRLSSWSWVVVVAFVGYILAFCGYLMRVRYRVDERSPG